jgi:hypothetical protein
VTVNALTPNPLSHAVGEGLQSPLSHAVGEGLQSPHTHAVGEGPGVRVSAAFSQDFVMLITCLLS